MTQGNSSAKDEDDTMMGMLDELVFGMKTFVTFRSVSSKLKIPSESASNVLERFAQKNAQKLSTTYVLNGKKADGSIVVRIVSEEQLDNVKKDIDVVLSERVYAIRSKSSSNDTKEDLSVRMWESDWEMRKKVLEGNQDASEMFYSDKYGAIKANQSIVRRGGPIKVTRPSALAQTKKNKTNKPVTKKSSACAVTETTSKPLMKKTSTHPDLSKSSSSASGNTSSKKTSSFTKTKKKKKGGMMGAWLKSSGSSSSQKSEKQTIDNSSIPTNDVDTPSEEVDTTNKKRKTSPEKMEERKKKKGRIRKKSRVDSSDEEVEEEEENSMEDHEMKLAMEEQEEEAKMSIEEEPVEGGLDMRTEEDMERERKLKRAAYEKAENEAKAAAELAYKKLRQPRKRLVKKSYTDEDGFLVQEEVWEPITDDEEVAAEEATSQESSQPKNDKKRASPSAKNAANDDDDKKKEPKKKKRKKKTAQKTTMMSFFTKK